MNFCSHFPYFLTDLKFKVKNTLVKSADYIKQYTSCSLVKNND